MLGNQRSKTAAFIVTEIEPKTAALLARNPWSNGFPSRIAFMDMAGKQRGCSADRAEFIGRHGSLAEPAALIGSRPLSNRVGGGLDPCGAMQTKISLSPGEEMQLRFCSERRHPAPPLSHSSNAIGPWISTQCSRA